MKYFVTNKRRFLISIVCMFISFSLLVNWLFFYYIKASNENYKKEESNNIVNQVSLLYQQEDKLIKIFDPLVTKSLDNIVRNIGHQIKDHPNVDSKYLQEIAKQNRISGIWLIEGDKIIRISSEGETEVNVNDWYRLNGELYETWQQKMEMLFERKDYVWVDDFRKMEQKPNMYLKRGYIGLGEIASIKGKVVLEVGLSFQDSLNVADVKDLLESNKLVNNKNIKSLELNVLEKGTTTNGLNYQASEGKGVVTSKVYDSDYQSVQIIAHTTFDSIDAENRNFLIFFIGSSIFTILIGCLVIITLLNKFKKG